MKKKFPKRYVVGEGFPWATGMGRVDAPYDSLKICSEPLGARFMALRFPIELWQADMPRYRVVLERLDD
jgi:hypothetical protein